MTTFFLLFLALSMSSGRPSGQPQDPELLSYQLRILQDLTSPDTQNIQNSTNMNGSDVLAVYGQYMSNVKRRREDQRGQSGRKERREAAKSIFILNGTRKQIEDSNQSGEMKMIYDFSVDLGTDVRVKKATFLGGTQCRVLTTGNNLVRREDENDVTEIFVRWTKRISEDQFPLEVVCSSAPTSVSLRLTTTQRAERQKRSPELINRLNKWRGRTNKCEEAEGGEKIRHGGCCRRKLKIQMRDLGMLTNAIIQPESFDAYMCEGKCNGRNGGFATNHAVFQHLIHKKKGVAVAPRPCCSPTSYSELDIIYKVPRTGNIAVAVISNAIVEGCSCS